MLQNSRINIVVHWNYEENIYPFHIYLVVNQQSLNTGLFCLSPQWSNGVEAANRGATQWVGHVIKIEKQ